MKPGTGGTVRHGCRKQTLSIKDRDERRRARQGTNLGAQTGVLERRDDTAGSFIHGCRLGHIVVVGDVVANIDRRPSSTVTRTAEAHAATDSLIFLTVVFCQGLKDDEEEIYLGSHRT